MNKRMIAVVACSLLLACGGGSPTAPDPPSLTGSWSGSYVVTVGGTGSGTVQLQLILAESLVTGSGRFDDVTGTVIGAAAPRGGPLQFDFNPSNPAECSVRFTGTWSATRITGTWVLIQCSAGVGGTLELRR